MHDACIDGNWLICSTIASAPNKWVTLLAISVTWLVHISQPEYIQTFVQRIRRCVVLSFAPGMNPTFLVLVLKFIVFQSSTATNKTKLYIGGIFGGRSNPLEAAHIAIEDINEKHSLLPNHELVLIGYSNPSTKVMYSFLSLEIKHRTFPADSKSCAMVVGVFICSW